MHQVRIISKKKSLFLTYFRSYTFIFEFCNIFENFLKMLLILFILWLPDIPINYAFPLENKKKQKIEINFFFKPNLTFLYFSIEICMITSKKKLIFLKMVYSY